MYLVPPQHLHGSIRGFVNVSPVDKHIRHYFVSSFLSSTEHIEMSSGVS